jgi:hypothetical protein
MWSIQMNEKGRGQYGSAHMLLSAGILDACRRVIEQNWPREQLTESNL